MTKRMHRFLVVIEKANGNYSAYSPDLPGCVATGRTRQVVERNMHKAIVMHVQGLLEDNLPIPESQSSAEYIAVQVGYDDQKESRLTKAKIGHLKGVGSFKTLREFLVDESMLGDMKTGDKIDVSVFEKGDKIEVSGITKSSMK